MQEINEDEDDIELFYLEKIVEAGDIFVFDQLALDLMAFLSIVSGTTL